MMLGFIRICTSINIGSTVGSNSSSKREVSIYDDSGGKNWEKGNQG
jgi:hypothetical protein